MEIKKRKGLFITFEGGEGSGKSSLIERLAEYLDEIGIPTSQLYEPGCTEAGESIRDLILSEPMSAQAEALLYAAARTELVNTVIKPALEAGKIVLCDRYIDSSYVYQGATKGISDEFIYKINGGASLPMPDCTILLDIDPRIGQERTRKRGCMNRFDLEPLEFHESVRKAYFKLMSKDIQRFTLIDASEDPEAVYWKSRDLILQLLDKEGWLDYQS